MKPAQVLDSQADLMSRLDDHRFRRVTAASYALDLGMEQTRAGSPERQQMIGAGTGLTDTLVIALASAYAYHVTDDMSVMVQYAASALDDDDIFDARLAPTGTGIVRFDRPLPVQDVRGKTLKVHWIVWGPVMVNGVRGTSLTFYNDSHDPDDSALAPEYAEMAHILGRWNWVGANLIKHRTPVGAEVHTMSDEQAALVVADGDVAHDASNPIRYVHALWALLGQRLTAVTDGHLTRDDRRRAARKGLPARVSVIALRSTDNARQPGESLVEWSHRWPVRPHWRWSPHGPRKDVDCGHVYGEPESSPGGVIKRCTQDGCENYAERTFINLFLKGPEGAPIIASDKVYSLRR